MNPFSPNTGSFKAPAKQPPTDLNAFLFGIGSTGLNSSGQPIGSTGGLIPMQRSEQDQLATFTAPSQAGYNGSVTNPLQKLNDLLGIQAPQQEMRVPQSQFALPQGNGQGNVSLPMQGAPSSTPMIGDQSHIRTQAPTPVSAFGKQVQEATAEGWSGVAKNGALFSATDNGFSITQDPSTVPQSGPGQAGLPQFLQGVSPQTIAPVINAMSQGGDPQAVRQALLAGAPAPQGLSAEQQAAWTLEQAALGQQSAALYDQIRGSGIGSGQYGRGMLTNAYNQALGGSNGRLPGLTPVQAIAGQVQTRQDAARLGGQPMTSAQMESLRKSGFDFKATPAGDGTFIVKDVSPFGPTNKPTTEEEVKTQEATMRSKASFDDNQAIATLGQTAETAIRDIDRAAALIDAGAKTGFAGDWILQAKQLGAALGMDVKGVKEGEELRNLFGNFVMARVQQTKGAVSNAEMKLFDQYSPSLTKTPEGNKAILAYARQAYDRSRQIGQLVDNLRSQNISEGEIKRQVNDFREKNPLDASVLKNPPASQTGSGLTPEARRARIEELRSKLGGNR